MKEAPETGLTAEQRAVLEPELRRYGSGWELSEVEKAYIVTATQTAADRYELHFVARGHSGLYSRPQIVIGGSFSGSNLHVPDDPELTRAQRERADTILRAASELWLLTRGRCTLLDVSTGLSAIVGSGSLQTRLHAGNAVLAVTHGHGDPFVVVVDLRNEAVVEAGTHSMPPRPDTTMLSADEVAFIDRALREHGSFGVYGDVTAGLRVLVRDFDVRLRRNEARYQMSVIPRDGYGHELGFSIDRSSGTIDDMAAGHLATS